MSLILPLCISENEGKSFKVKVKITQQIKKILNELFELNDIIQEKIYISFSFLIKETNNNCTIKVKEA